MTIKERLEQQERAVLGPRAMLSCQSRGREKPISADDMRTEFSIHLEPTDGRVLRG